MIIPRRQTSDNRGDSLVFCSQKYSESTSPEPNLCPGIASLFSGNICSPNFSIATLTGQVSCPQLRVTCWGPPVASATLFSFTFHFFYHALTVTEYYWQKLNGDGVSPNSRASPWPAPTGHNKHFYRILIKSSKQPLSSLWITNFQMYRTLSSSWSSWELSLEVWIQSIIPICQIFTWRFQVCYFGSTLPVLISG